MKLKQVTHFVANERDLGFAVDQIEKYSEGMAVIKSQRNKKTKEVEFAVFRK